MTTNELDDLVDESIMIIRDAVAEARNPVMLYELRGYMHNSQ
jgi:hypothetical protein